MPVSKFSNTVDRITNELSVTVFYMPAKFRLTSFLNKSTRSQHQQQQQQFIFVPTTRTTIYIRAKAVHCEELQAVGK